MSRLVQTSGSVKLCKKA